MVEGRAGDLIVIAALDRETGKKAAHRLTSEATEIKITDRPSDWRFTPGADSRDLPPPRLQRVRIFRDPHDSEWKDEKGYRSPDEIEQPVESWSQSQAAAERFAGASGRQGKHWSVVLEAPEDAQQDAFKDVSSLVRWLARDDPFGRRATIPGAPELGADSNYSGAYSSRSHCSGVR